MVAPAAGLSRSLRSLALAAFGGSVTAPPSGALVLLRSGEGSRFVA